LKILGEQTFSEKRIYMANSYEELLSGERMFLPMYKVDLCDHAYGYVERIISE
jgi:hypothetical protein